MLKELPRSRDAEATRETVLDAAEKLFCQSGFSGTSMRDLAAASGFSQPLLHHHFGSKRNLYQAVKRRAIERFESSHPGAVEEEDEVDLRMELEQIFKFLQNNRSLLRLDAWARLEGEVDLWPGQRQLVEALCARIRKSQQSGAIDPTFEPAYLAILLVAVTYYWVDQGPAYASVLDSQNHDEAYLAQAMAILGRGVLPYDTPWKNWKDPSCVA